jgi:hypothetical protein
VADAANVGSMVAEAVVRSAVECQNYRSMDRGAIHYRQWTAERSTTVAYGPVAPAEPAAEVPGSLGAGNSFIHWRLICVAHAPGAIAGSMSVTTT